MRYTVLFILSGFLFHFTLCAQKVGERVWLHTDAPAYHSGDRVHFKAYILDMDEKVSTAQSRYLYVELGKDGVMVGKRVKVQETEGRYVGYMDIPEDAVSGVYSLRAYTLGMGRAGVFSYQDIQVGRPHHLVCENADTTLFSSFSILNIPVRLGLTPQRDSAILQLDMSGLLEGEWADLSVSVFNGGHRPLPPYGTSAADRGALEREVTQTLCGQVLTSWREKPVEDAKVSLISPQAGIFSVTSTDKDGAFVFDGLDFPEGTQYVLRTDDKRLLQIQETVYPEYASSGRCYRDEGWAVPFPEWPDDAIELDAATAVATAVVDPPKGFSALADFSFGPNQISDMSATCMHEVLRRVPGIFIREEKAYLRAAVSIYGDFPAAIAIDGVILEGDYDLDCVEMSDVERVDVFKTGQTVIWGARGGAGVISITTKKGDFVPQQASEYLNQKKVTLLGYQRPAPYKPSAQTIYWNPAIRSDVISFPMPKDGCLGICIEGVTSLGRIVSSFVSTSSSN